jgi:hypothetical protein
MARVGSSAGTIPISRRRALGEPSVQLGEGEQQAGSPVAGQPARADFPTPDELLERARRAAQVLRRMPQFQGARVNVVCHCDSPSGGDVLQDAALKENCTQCAKTDNKKTKKSESEIPVSNNTESSMKYAESSRKQY